MKLTRFLFLSLYSFRSSSNLLLLSSFSSASWALLRSRSSITCFLTNSYGSGDGVLGGLGGLTARAPGKILLPAEKTLNQTNCVIEWNCVYNLKYEFSFWRRFNSAKKFLPIVLSRMVGLLSELKLGPGPIWGERGEPEKLCIISLFFGKKANQVYY